MADHTFSLDLDPQQQRVAVTVGRGRNQLQPVAGCFPFRPELAAGAAEKRHVTGQERALARLAIHEAQHQHFPIGGILHDGRRQALHLVKIDLHLHSVLSHDRPKNKKPAELGSHQRARIFLVLTLAQPNTAADTLCA